jgi:putative membrane protein
MFIKGILATILFSLVGMVMMFVGFKIIDRITPGHLTTELIEHKNVAVAMVVSSMIIGVSIIVAAAIVG